MYVQTVDPMGPAAAAGLKVCVVDSLLLHITVGSSVVMATIVISCAV